MSRQLTEQPNLDYLKREAKRLLRAVRSSETDALALVRELPQYATADDERIASATTLLEIQLVLARDYGFAGWPELKAFVESRTPTLSKARPVLRIGSFREALAHYRDWLGFDLDWDWYEAPGEPVIAAFSRDDVEFMVNEYPDTPGPTTLHINVANFEALVDELNSRGARPVTARLAPPFEFHDLPITDPWGNIIVFEGQNVAAATAQQESVRPQMRRYIQDALDRGAGFPTPEELRDAVGPPLGTAIEVLNEFDGYGEVFKARRQASESSDDDR